MDRRITALFGGLSVSICLTMTKNSTSSSARLATRAFRILSSMLGKMANCTPGLATTMSFPYLGSYALTNDGLLVIADWARRSNLAGDRKRHHKDRDRVLNASPWRLDEPQVVTAVLSVRIAAIRPRLHRGLARLQTFLTVFR